MDKPDQLENNADYLFFKKDRGFDKVFMDEIQLGEAKGSYTNVHTEKGNYLISRNLSHLFKRLDSHPDFVRVHRSYFVNIRKVETYYKEYLVLAGMEIPVSKAYRIEISKRFIFF